MAYAIPQTYRQPILGRIDPRFRKCLLFSGGLGLLFLIAVLLAPVTMREITSVDEMPERFARLILEEPKVRPQTAAPPAAEPAAPVTMETPAEEAAAEPAPEQIAEAPEHVGARRLEAEPAKAADRGEAGRAKAQQEVAQHLSGVSGSLDQVIAELSTSLANSTPSSGVASAVTARKGTIKAARSAEQIGDVTGGGGGSVAVVAAASALGGSSIAIEGIIGGGASGSASSSAGARAGGRAGGRGGGSGGLATDARSNASLLAVVRRYAAGIQFCYENELKKSPGLGGRLVVSITVAASGAVTECGVVQDTVGSPALASCALAQIREWRFPAIDQGIVAFKTPFIFTPPD